MPSGKGGTGNTALDIGTIIAGGLGGFGDNNTSISGSGSSNSNSTATSNTNTYSNTNSSAASTSWLESLLNAIQQMQGSSTTSFNLDPQTQALLNKLVASYSNLATPFDSRSYQATQTQGINTNADLAKQAVEANMAARGVSGPAAATAVNNIDANRIGQITQLQQQLPFLANQYNVGNLGAAGNFFSAIPKSTTVNTNQTNTSSQTGSQNTGSQSVAQNSNVGGSDSYAASWNRTDQTSNQNQSKKGGLFSGLAGLAATAASLFSDKTLKKEIQPIKNREILDRVMKLQPVSWRWKEDNEKTVGLIAQDLKKVMPELVHKDEDSGKFKVNYAGLLSELVGAVQAIGEEVAR